MAFDRCDPPVCSEDISVEVIEFACGEDNILIVSWVIHDIYDRDLTSILNSNKLLWSCDSSAMDNSINSSKDVEPYRASIDTTDCDGSITFQVKIRIGVTFFESDIEIFDTNDCGTGDDSVVRARWCGHCPNATIFPVGEPDLYVRAKNVPYTPIYFEYLDTYCFYVESLDNLIPEVPPGGSFIEDIENGFSSCDICCEQLDCPSDGWTELPESAQGQAGDRVGTFYFEYETYSCPDRLYIIRNFEDSDCDTETPPAEKIMFDTGCVSTSSGEGPQFSVPTPVCMESPDWRAGGTRGFCLSIKVSELPIGIINDCDCSDSCSTLWKICTVTPDGETLSWEGSNECLCEDAGVDNPLSGEWEEVAAELNDQGFVWSMAIFDDELYAGVGVGAGAGDGGRLFKWNEVDAWEQAAPTLNGQKDVYSLTVFNIASTEELYGTTGQGGRLFKWNGSNKWDEVAPNLGEGRIFSSAVFDNGSGEELYAGTFSNGNLFKWDEIGEVWEIVAPQFDTDNAIFSLLVFDNGSVEELYGSTSGGKLLKWNGSDAWELAAPMLNGQPLIWSLTVFKGDIYASTATVAPPLDGGRLFKWNGVDAWEQVASQLNNQYSIYSLVVFNNKIYAGTTPNGLLFEWNESAEEWIQAAPQKNNQLTIQSLIVFNGNLYGSTLFDGRLFRFVP